MPATTIDFRPIETSLLYFSGKDPSYTVDVTQPGGAECDNNVENSNSSFPVKVHDVRGLASQFSLETNGFVFANHKIDGLEGCTTEERM